MLHPLISLQNLLDRTRAADWLAPLALRLYLAPVMAMAGWSKLAHFEDTVAWFGADGLGLPLPALMTSLAIAAELGGAISLVLGLALRWMCIPMMATMIVAAITVHLENGWLAIAEASGPFATERTQMAAERLEQARDILMQHADYDYLTEFGSLIMLNNGIEFSVTYLFMLLALFFSGAGRWISLDHWLRRRFMAAA